MADEAICLNFGHTGLRNGLLTISNRFRVYLANHWFLLKRQHGE